MASQDYLNDVELGEKGKGTAYTSKGGDNQVVMRGIDQDDPEGVVHRHLKARHLQMIALGGCIGTGLFVGAGGALAGGGPLGLWLGYSVMGIAVGCMMIALGEMTTLYPVSGAFVHYSARFVDPALGFALGWNYWYSYAITLPTEITAAAGVISFWRDDINIAVWISVFYVVIIAFNFLGVRAYGEAEFWFSILKILTILGLIICGIVITAGGAGNDPIGFQFWRNPGAFQQLNGIPGSLGRFLAFWSTLVQGAFSYLGTEIVALTAGEAENPRRNMPKAIRRVFFRILFFYVVGTFVIGLIVSPDEPSLTEGSGVLASPWVIAIQNAGISGLPSVVNAAVLLSAFSAGNSDLYASSRTLYGLACDGKAPAIFRRCTKNGLPIWCLVLTASIGLLAYMNVGTGSSTAFDYLSNLSSITGLITWDCILLSYLRFYHGLKKQGRTRDDHPYRAPFQPWASYIAFTLIFLVIWTNGFTVFLAGSWDTADFIVDYITLVIFAILFVFWKFFKRTKFVRLDQIDYETGKRELDAIADEEAAKYKEPTTILGPSLAIIRRGFQFWRNPGAFQQLNGIPGSLGRFLAFWSTLVQGAFSYLGTEIVALTAGEAENPRRNMPKAIRRVFFRILFFYVVGTFVIGLIVSPDEPSLTEGSGVLASPWVIAIQNAGISGLPSVVNAAVLLSAFSAGNSDLYASSRTLYGLACDGKAPAIFRRCTKNGLPFWCLVLTASIGLLAYMNVGTGSSTAFDYLSNLSSITGLITWDCILLSYLRFYHGLKKQGRTRDDHPYRAPFQPWASYIAFTLIFLVIWTNGFTVFLAGSWDTADIVIDYSRLHDDRARSSSFSINAVRKSTNPPYRSQKCSSTTGHDPPDIGADMDKGGAKERRGRRTWKKRAAEERRRVCEGLGEGGVGESGGDMDAREEGLGDEGGESDGRRWWKKCERRSAADVGV
ncbi:hypothetical protein JCM10207_002695 [Rhodosporidiobolus poonsookiae]